MRTTDFAVVLLLGLAACGDDASPGAGEGNTDTDTGGIETLNPGSSGSGDVDEGSGATTDPPASTGEPPTGGGSDGPTECMEGVVYECGDGEDNDGDGLTDLADPECTGPCDNDEASFQTGIPGDNVDCFQDCFFDGNSGHEDDMCWWNITCDPANPGEGGMCAYEDTPMCNMTPPYDNSDCAENCLGGTPNGCDCFGCCTVVADGEEVHVWLGSGPDCAIDNLDACTTCTPSEDCNNPCDEDECEVCFGGELPDGCDDPDCPSGIACTIADNGTDNCPSGFYCFQGCCTDYEG